MAKPDLVFPFRTSSGIIKLNQINSSKVESNNKGTCFLKKHSILLIGRNSEKTPQMIIGLCLLSGKILSNFPIFSSPSVEDGWFLGKGMTKLQSDINFIRETSFKGKDYVLSTGNKNKLEIWDANNFKLKEEHGK
jgi:hypothetical protein